MPDPFAPSVPYDPRLAAAVWRGVRAGETLTQVCSRKGMPDRGVVLEWAEAEPEFAERLDYACRLSARFMAEELVDQCRGGDLPPALVPATYGQRLSRDRLAFAAIRLLMSIYDPQTFGRLRGPYVSPYRPSFSAPPRPPAAAEPPSPAVSAPPPVSAEDPARAAFRAEAAALDIDAEATEVLLEQAEAEGLFDASDEADEAAAPAAAAPARSNAGRTSHAAAANAPTPLAADAARPASLIVFPHPPARVRRRNGRLLPPAGALALASSSDHALLCGLGGASSPARSPPRRPRPDTSPPPI